MNGESAASPDDDPLGPIVESFLDRFRRGERPALTDLIACHPELADRIRELIPALVKLEQLGGSTGDFIPSPQHRTGWRAAADEGPSPGRLGDYVILRRIGAGGMGVVYEAEHDSLKSRMALKVMHPRFRADPKYLRRFHVEARLAAGLHHTNIVSVFDYGEQEGVCYYAMQFIQGQPLDRVLADIRRLRDEGTDANGLIDPDAIKTIPGEDNSLATSIAARGLVTSHFVGPSLPIAETIATGKATTASVALVPGDPASSREAILEVGEFGQHQGPRSPAQRVQQPVQTDPSTLGSSSLGGSSELRYFREIARVGAQVADAVEYAHRRGVLHRDIKPSNLLVDALGNVWVTDFGLAKLEEGDDLSQSRELVGTLRYMAPERFRGASDRRGDIYSLGATLYELLALRPLFEESDQIRLIERIRNDAPAPPRQLDRNIPRDLETIVLKALAKDPKDRFGSAGELADELRRFVEGRPIRSRPVSVAERFWRWCKRDPWLAGANIAAALLTTALALGGTWSALVYRGQVARISEQNEQILGDYVRIQQAESATQRNLFKSLLTQARATRLSRREGQRFNALAALEQAAGIAGALRLPADQLDPLRDEAIACLALPDLRPVGRGLTRPPTVIMAAFDPTLTRYALRFRDGTISVRCVADDQEIARFQARGDRGYWIFGFSPDGHYLATTHFPGGALTVWDVDRRAVCFDEPGPIPGFAARFSPDSRRLALVNEKSSELLVYDLVTGRPIRRWAGTVGCLAFRPDGAQVAAIDNQSKPPTWRILDAESGRLVQAFPLRVPADDVAWSPDGRTLATTSNWPDFKIDLWETTTGVRRATLEGHDNSGLRASFHPAGTLLASNGYEGRLRLWDPIQGRPLFSLTGASELQFSQDGRIVVALEDKLTTYLVEPALEYRTFAHASSQPIIYARASIRRDGRILAVGTDHGTVLWDLARGTELAFLPIGNAWSVRFEPLGDLITSGDIGVQRWPIRIDAGRGEFRIGPPHRLPLPASHGTIDQDRSGRIVAVAAGRYAYAATPERTIYVGPLDDCRGVAVSPDGRWLATGSHVRGAQVWRIDDGTKVADLPLNSPAGWTSFSPDGKWLAVGDGLLWEVGSWREGRQIRGIAGFSPDGRLVVVADPNRIIRLVELATGRTLARLESPDLCGVGDVAFSSDGARLVVSSNDRPAPAVHVWDLRAIRKHLARIGLDWDAPAYTEDDPDCLAPPLPTLQVDYGPVAGHLEHFSEDAGSLLKRYTERLASDPRDPDAYHHRAHALVNMRRTSEAIADLNRAIELRPDDAHYLGLRGAIYLDLKQYELAITDLEAALKLKPDLSSVRQSLALSCNNRAWELANSPEPRSGLARALKLVQRAVNLSPGEGVSLNTMGVVLYRLGRYNDAIATLERSRAAHQGQFDGFDLFFLAMAHHRLERREKARACYDLAVRWMGQPHTLDAQSTRDLAAFRAEAEAVFADPAGDLPEQVFAPAR